MKTLKRMLMGMLVLAAAQAPAQSQMPPVPVDTAVRIGILPNGLK